MKTRALLRDKYKGKHETGASGYPWWDSPAYYLWSIGWAWKIVSKGKTNYLDTGTSCLVPKFIEVLWLTSFGRINHHTCWKSLCWNLWKGTVCLFTNTQGSDKHILVRQKDQGSLNFQVTTWGRRRQLITICRPFKRPLRQLSLGSYVFQKKGISRNTSTS